MGMFWVRASAGAFAAFALMSGTPAVAADQEAGQVMAQQLTERTREPESSSEGSEKKLSDSAVRVMTSYAWSIMPEQLDAGNGTMISIDKSDPAKIIIPVDDARDVIRAAMRSAYAEICDVPELGQKNFRTMMDAQERRGIWTLEQMQFINTLHMFSVSYFTGDMKITEKEGDEAADGAASKANEDDEAFNPKRPTCTPEKKQAVTEAINEYLQTVEAEQAAQPASPVPSGQVPSGQVPSGQVPMSPEAPLAQPVAPNNAGAN
ncbi:hypothetical protein A7A08_00719 [Methyloligella halotolerans]|uniref:Uncharacterized protein n=1 Tax=Methyloligella halotolerans TaxID=1177755 RepID=A0A1E2S3H1_9HYPH|nr:hypothetical protein [Methyloligella halotolerans]ODA68885.1 hypothetical protein A7A08_00719 [Methyloligella halotolerans]